MSEAVTITDQATAALKKLQPEHIMPVLKRVMDEENVYTVSHIQQVYLNYPRTGPTTPDGLRNMSGSYLRSLRAGETTISGSELISSIGTNVNKGGFSYPSLHEFGGTIHRRPRIGVARLRTDKSGQLIRQGKNGKLAIFAARKDRHYKSVAFSAEGHDVTYPARAPITRGIRDRLPEYTKALSAAIIQEVKP